MPTRTEIIEAGAEALHDTQWSGDWGVANEYERTIFIGQAEAALAAMLPLIKAQMVEKVLADLVYDDTGELNTFNSGQEYTARLIAGFEL